MSSAVQSLPAEPLSELAGASPGREEAARAQMRAALATASAQVLREMRRHRGWSGAPDADIEDALQEAVLVLLQGPVIPHHRVLMSLRAAAGLRRRQYWHIRRNRPAGRHVELTDDLASATADENTTQDAWDNTATAAAMFPYAADCLAELTQTQVQIYARIADGQREADIAEALGLAGRKAVQAERYTAEHTIAMFAQVVHAGRVCGKRAIAISDYAAGKASSENIRRAEAHLASCEPCAASFRAAKRDLGRQVAALIPAPMLAVVAVNGRSGAGGILARLADLLPPGTGGGRVATLREAALGALVRNPGSVETVTGASLGGAGLAAGAKVAIGLCAVAIAGGGAVCSSLGVLPDALSIRQPAKEQPAKTEPKPKTKPKTKATTTALVAPPPATTVPTARTAPDPAVRAAAAARLARAERKRARARARARAARAAATNPLQSPSPAASVSPSVAAAAPPTAPQFAPAPKPSTDPRATPSPALTGGSNPLQGRTP
jgi:hypothetical protein